MKESGFIERGLRKTGERELSKRAPVAGRDLPHAGLRRQRDRGRRRRRLSKGLRRAYRGRGRGQKRGHRTWPKRERCHGPKVGRGVGVSVGWAAAWVQAKES